MKGVLVFFLGLCSIACAARSQEWEDDSAWSAAFDSIVTISQRADSLFRSDSVRLAIEFGKLRQFATMRELDLTGDGIPERLRLEGKADTDARKVKLEFTIRSKKKLLFKDTWRAESYFEDRDTLSNFTRTARLHRIVTVFFANENFQAIDSVRMLKLLQDVSPGEVRPGSSEFTEIFSKPRIMYSVYRSRDEWYGLVWNERRRKFSRLWQN
jgi:hypothetical protein